MISCLLKIEALYPAAVNDILQTTVILRDQNNCFWREKIQQLQSVKVATILD